MRTLPSDFNGFRLANSKFGFVITLKGLELVHLSIKLINQGLCAHGFLVFGF